MNLKVSVETFKSHKLSVQIFLFIGLLLLSANIFAQDPNFYIYLCFGQSNMEGQGDIEPMDQTVDPRFQVMEAVNCSGLGRTMGSWYPAVPPLCRCYTGLCPTDYFGRTMVENLPDSIRVGVINVSVAGCKIELFDKDTYAAYAATVESWMTSIINEYDGNPYGRLVEMAQLAQQDGVIKGILLHQGESNSGDNQWPSKIKKIYNDLMVDLSLDPDSIPLLAGEVVNADQGGVCAGMNAIIAKLPQTLPNSYVISSSQCTDGADNLHFDSAGYRKLGARYAVKMLSLMGIEIEDPEDPDTSNPEGTVSIYLEPECAMIGDNWAIVDNSGASHGQYVTAKPGLENVSAAATDSASCIYFPFSLDSTGNFYIYARMNNASYDDDSYWVAVDNGQFSMCNGLVTSGWGWLNLNTYALTAGKHVLTITYREDGSKLDKICISNGTSAPQGMGEDAENLCDTDVIDLTEIPSDYALAQNYPNPFNPSTHIDYALAVDATVALKIYDTLGANVFTLFEGQQPAGRYSMTWNGTNQNGNILPTGNYFIKLTVRKDGSTVYQTARKILLMK